MRSKSGLDWLQRQTRQRPMVMAVIAVALVGVGFVVISQASNLLAGQEAEDGIANSSAEGNDGSALAGNGRKIAVTTSAELSAALEDARPGDTIKLADGTYDGRFNSTKSGTAQRPITVMGSRNAIIDGGSLDSGYTFSLGKRNSADEVRYWKLSGFTVTGGNKGIIFDNVQHSIIDNLLVQNTGQEAVHLRNFSSDNVIKNSTIAKTGLVTQGYGEGLYIGTAVSNWENASQGKPDHSNNNQIINNHVSQTAAESIDIKEGTHGGLIQGNTFIGSGMCPRPSETCNYADSLLDMKGEGWLVKGNIGSNVHASWKDDGVENDAFQVHVTADTGNERSGQNNIFEDNRLSDVDGYGFNIEGNPAGTLVRCNNTVTDAGKGFGNVQCRN